MNLPAKLVVDANPIISTLIGGAAHRIFWHQDIDTFLTTEWTLGEVRKYLPKLAKKAQVPEELMETNLKLLPLKNCTPDFYQTSLPEAAQQIEERDPKDVEILALALQTGYPLWTNDKDFEITTVKTYSTFELLAILEIHESQE